MVSVILSDTQSFDPKFKFGIDIKENKTSKEVGNHQSAVKIQAAALNHRDVWILKNQYGGITLGSVLGSDGVGYVTKNGQVGQRVLINPGKGWASDERGPEKEFHILGLLPAIGTLTEEEVIVDQEDIVPCPEHLSLEEAAALPLAGLTAYRAVFTKGLVKKDDHVLVTGIGGGVALFALQFAVAAGAHVYVTSSSQEKIQKAIELGAKGGINYKDEKCIEELKKLLGGNQLFAVIDGAGGPLYAKYPQVMRTGGILVNYGQTASAREGVKLTMHHVVKNIEFRGSTMGSRAEFKKMVQFVDQHKVKPIVSKVWKGLTKESIEDSVLTMSRGEQFEKHNSTKEEEPTTNYSVKEGWIQLTEEYEARKTSEPTDSNSLFYAVLKHGTLFCYESDTLTNVCKILPIQDYTVSLYPEDKAEQQLFSRLSVIKLSHPNKTLYLNCHRKIDKEDWYLGLLEAHCMLQDSPDKAQYDMIDNLHFDPCAIEQLIFRVQSTPSQRETSWMNAILGRIFLSVYKAETFKDYVKTKIAKKINNKRPSFLEEISVRKVDVGPSLPSITNPILKSISKEGEVIAEATVDYLGGLTVEIETDLNWSYSSRLKPIRMNLVLAVTLKRLAGRLVFMIKAPPTDRYWLAFDEMPEMEWKITPVVADKQITLSIVTNAIESRIREVMAETFVLPNMDDTPLFKRDDGIIRDLSSKLDEKVLGEAFSAKTEIVHQTLPTKHVSQPHENSSDRSNSFLRKRHKVNEDAESTKSNYSGNSVSSNSSSGSSFLRKLTNYLPSESPTSIRRHTLIHKAEEFINKRTTENIQTSIEARRTSREEEKYETSLLQSTPLSVQPRSRASSFINDSSSIPASMTNKPPLPPRRNSTPIPFQKEEIVERSATAPAIPNKPRPVITQRKPPLPSRPNNNTSENPLSS